jgi:PAS domain S-box-containing protein
MQSQNDQRLKCFSDILGLIDLLSAKAMVYDLSGRVIWMNVPAETLLEQNCAAPEKCLVGKIFPLSVETGKDGKQNKEADYFTPVNNKKAVLTIKAGIKIRIKFSIFRSPTDSESDPVHLMVFTEDLDKGDILKQLDVSQRRFQSTIEASPMGMHFYELDDNGRLIFVGANSAADKILGVENMQFIGKPIETAFPALTQTEVPARYKEAARDGKTWKTEQVTYNENGISGAFEVFAYQIETNKMVAMFFDITERKQTEWLLKESEQRKDLALIGGDLGTWDWNIATNKVVFNERWASMLGYDVGELAQDYSTWETLMHPADFPEASSALQNHLGGNVPNFEKEYRLRHKDGSWIWVMSKGQVIERDEQGKPVRACGTHLDITERKKAEEELRIYVREKEILLSEIHHRVKNNMQLIMSLLSMQKEWADSAIIPILDDVIGRIRVFSEIHEGLYHQHLLAQIDFIGFIKANFNFVCSLYGQNRDNFQLTVSIDKPLFSLEIAVPCGLLINELMTNSIKHALHGSGEISVLIEKDAQDRIQNLVYKDSGKDLGVYRAGFGTLIVNTISQQLDLELVSHSEKRDFFEFQRKRGNELSD